MEPEQSVSSAGPGEDVPEYQPNSDTEEITQATTLGDERGDSSGDESEYRKLSPVTTVEEPEDEEDYDPEIGFTSSEPADTNTPIADSNHQSEVSKTGATMDSVSDADTESNYEPELPTDREDDQDKTEGATSDHTSNENSENVEVSPESRSPEPVTIPRDVSEPAASPVREATPESDNEYDPENNDLPGSTEHEHAPSLPPKPTLQNEQTTAGLDLKEAYEAIMQSEVVKSEQFAQLSKEKQMEVISELLREKQITLPGTQSSASSTSKASSNGSVPQSAYPTDHGRPNISTPMTEEEIQAYNRFLDAEAEYLNSGKELPEESRLFVGNLASNLVTKQDLFRLFRRYGELVEISIKAGFGFAQFTTRDACAACTQGEAGFPLHGRPLRLNASHKRKNTHGVPENNIRGRERSSDDGFRESESKRIRTDVEDVNVIVTGKATESFVTEVEHMLQKDNLTLRKKNVGQEDPADVIRDAAYSGVLCACVIKDSKVDVQIFEETGDGGVKFDEYLAIDPPAASEIIRNAKRSRTQKSAEPSGGPGSRRQERAARHKTHTKMRNNIDGLQDPRRGGSQDRYFNSNDRGRGAGRQPYQSNAWQGDGYHGAPRNDWNQRPPHGNSYSNYPGQRNVNYQGLGSGYDNQGPGFNTNQRYNQGGYANQGYGRGPYQNTGNQGYPSQQYGDPSQGAPMNYSQGGFNSGPAQPPPPGLADPALVSTLQTLQNLDPNTMRSVVALLQQQNGQPPAPPAQGLPPYQIPAQVSPYQQSSPSAQVNSLRAQLQSQSTPQAQPIAAPLPQQPQQPYNSANPQQQSKKSLMDMLSRLGG